MGLGTIIGDVLTVGGTARRRKKKAKKERAAADALIAQNTALAEQMFNRDLGASRLEGMDVSVAADPRMIAEQNRVLGELGTISREGFTATDRGALDEAQRQAMGTSRREEQAQREAVLGAAARRGDVRGGNALMASLAAQQGGANRQSDAGSQYATEIGLAGRDRARQALTESGTMAGQMRSQGFGEDQTNVGNQMAQAGGLDQFGQWRVGQQSQDAAMLMNARGGQSQNLNERAEQREQAFSQGIDQAVQIGGAIANAYTGGASGAVTNAVSAPGAKSAGQPTGATAPAPAPVAPGAGPMQKAQSRAPTPAPGALPAATVPSPGVGETKGRMPAPGTQPAAARPGPLGGALRNAMGGARPAPAAAAVANTFAAGAPAASPVANPQRPQTNARRRGGLLLGQPQGGLRGR